MKKTTAFLLLIIIMLITSIVVLASCNLQLFSFAKEKQPAQAIKNADPGGKTDASDDNGDSKGASSLNNDQEEEGEDLYSRENGEKPVHLTGEYAQTEWFPDNSWVYVNNEWLNVRTGPSTEEEIIREIYYGQAFRRIAVSKEWSLIILTDGLKGYTYNYYLSLEALEYGD